MVQVTDRALDKLEQMRQMGGLSEDQVIGIGVGQDGGLRFDLLKPTEQDEVIDRNGQPLIVVPAPLSDPLSGAVLDFPEDADSKFTLREGGAEEAT
ncbi:MAG: adhesin [Thermomicrobiales bacterium]